MPQTDSGEEQPSPILAFLDRLPASVRTKLITLYGESLSKDSSLIVDALSREDLQAAGALAHKLWGGAANLQDEQVARVAKLIETAAIEKRLDAAQAAGASLMAECQKSVAALSGYASSRAK